MLASDDCTIAELQRTEDGITFTRTDARLPLNLAPLWMLQAMFIPFADELYRYSLALKNLPEGRYEVTAAGSGLGT